MFECMEISESIYEGVVYPSYKKPTQADDNRSSHRRNKRREAASSNTGETICIICSYYLVWYIGLNKVLCCLVLEHHKKLDCEFISIIGCLQSQIQSLEL